ncbi:L-threonylcarbamoyladenylate synthase [Tenacibaculum geojense]|uniref:L-threonylcarbamoyladenylate synthase n=1 Tax=Tenacibaculum geojense TaxID=915352 RepID=A0ABW3JMP8_9FLAO
MKDEIHNSLSALESGKVILYPTDTVWGLGCDATNEEAVNTIFKLKNRVASKSLIVMVSSIEMLQEYIPFISEKALEILKSSQNPTTIIYNNPIGLAKNTIAEDNTVAIRIPDNEFCIQLIKDFNRPIVSTSANISGEPTPMSFSEISKRVLDSVDYVVNLQQDKVSTKSSTILKIEGEDIVVIRE